jgi:phospholipid/cholesterol/gamma-HCH transport system substrate-binding protein
MGAKAIELRYDRYCSGDDCAKDGDFIQGESLGMLSSMVPKDELNIYLDEISSTLKSLVTTLNDQMLSEDAEGPLANSLRDLESTMGNLKSTTGQLNSLMYRSSDELSGSLDNINTLTNTLADNNEAIKNILQNTDKFTSQLGELDLKATVEELETTVAALKSTIQEAETTFDGVNQVVDGIEHGEGTLGKLFQDPELYHELSSLSDRADSLINDIQSRPYRYVPLKSRKRVKRYDRKDEALEEEESGS